MTKSGFSLIEILIVVSILAFTIPIVFGLFFINLQSQTKVLILQEVKRNGDSALNTIEYLVKNRAYTLYSDADLTTEVCTTRSSSATLTSSSTVYFVDKNGASFNFAVDQNKLASFSATISPNPSYLTNVRVAVSNFTMSCNRTSSFNPPLVTIAFTVSQPSGNTRHEQQSTLNYQTKIKMTAF